MNSKNYYRLNAFFEMSTLLSLFFVLLEIAVPLTFSLYKPLFIATFILLAVKIAAELRGKSGETAVTLKKLRLSLPLLILLIIYTQCQRHNPSHIHYAM